MRHAWKVLIALALVGIGIAAVGPALASVPKVIFADEFGYAT
jgi:hypothetical protein